MKNNKAPSKTVMLIKKCMIEKILLLFGILLVSIIVVLLTSLSPIVYKMLIDDCIPNGLTNQIIIYVMILVCIPLLKLLLSFGKDRLVYNFSNTISEALRKCAYSACLNMEYEQFEKIGYQKAKQTLTREVGQICDVFLFGECLSAMNNGLQIVITFVVLLHLNLPLALGSFCVFPILYLVINKSKNNVSGLERKLMRLLGKCDNYLTHAFMGIKTIKSFNAQSYEMKEFEAWLDENREVNWKIKSAHAFARTILPNVVQQITYGLLLVICAYFVIKGQMTMGTLLASVSYVPILFTSMNALMGTKIGYASVSNSIKNLDELMDSRQEMGEIREIYPNEYAVQIHDLHFSYDRSDFQIQIDDLDIKKGEIVAVVGDSGSGKSALFDVLCRFYKVEKESVRVFGEKLNDIEPNTLRNLFRLVSQDTFLWNKSIEENILYPKRIEDKEEERYNECIKKAGLLSFLETLKQKDKTVLGDFGSQISGGEKQRIALARALYSDFQVLLLDEPTAALDSIRSELVFDTILAQKEKQKTVIVITHDIANAMRADTILVMKNGKIIEKGTPDELILNETQLKKLYQSFTYKRERGRNYL